MSVQQFCLRWNNHQPNFISVFSTLLHNETLVDVTLAAEGRQLQAHKVVLSACSSYFQTLFTTNPCQHPIVILKDVQYIHLKTMVDFMYYGEVNVSQEQLPHILKTAEMLKIKGLAEMPDATSLTKSESKSSSSDHIEQISGGAVGNESIWGSTESQQFHHQQQRRTPSPATLSPSTRRKRLRKSSTGSGTLSTERTSEEQSSIDGGSNLNIGQMDPMTTFVPSSGNISSNINNTRILKESSSTETEHPHQESSQESVEESMHHSSSAVMKTDDDMGNVSHTMPLDIAGSTSNTGQQQQQQQQQQPAVSCPQPQPGVQWTLIDSNYPRFYQPGLGMQTPTGQNNTDAHQNNSNNHNNNNSNSNNTNNNNNNNNNNNSNNPNGGNSTHPNSTNDENTGVQTLQYQQNPAYSPQIISVNPNNLMNSYQSSLSTPTSPSQENDSMVQSVYSQGPTPAQSPIQQIGNQGSNSGGSQMPVKRKRSVNPQGDENFIRALEAVRYGGIGFCKAARLYGVNNRTLWLEYKKRGYPISRPSIKSRIKLEPNMTPPPPTTPTNEENTMENYDQLTPTAINMATVPSSTEPTTPLMCPPHAHPMGVMSFLDTRHVEFPTAIHPMSRQRYADPSVNVNPTAMNLQGLNFNSM